MSSTKPFIEGVAAAIPLANLDTDQIMPKQFLRGIDKSGLDKGLLYDMRFDTEGNPRPDFVLNRAEYAETRLLVAGPNFGCGSSREHAVWGLLQFGIQAIIAPSFGEIFYSNAMNNRLLLIVVSESDANAFMHDIEQPPTAKMSVDLASMMVSSASHKASFTLSRRHREMFAQGHDLVGASLVHRDAIHAFARDHWNRFPWLQDVAGRTRARLEAPSTTTG